MNTITREIVQDKTILVRLDLDVPVSNGIVQDDTRLRAILPTLQLLRYARKVTIIGHLGRPKGTTQKELSLSPIADALSPMIGHSINFIPSWNDIDIRTSLDTHHAWNMLENLRFHEGEDDTQEDFSKQLASYADIFVFDAFAVSHRASASTVGIPRHIPSYAGLRITQEIAELSRAIEHPDHPFLVIIGGAKIETKLPMIQVMSTIADHVCVGGKLIHEIAEQQMMFSDHVIIGTPSPSGYDIDTASAHHVCSLIRDAQMVVWNGPVGKFEDPDESAGTKEIVHALMNTSAHTIIGGGETIQSVRSFGSLEKIGFVSVGGGAMIEFLSGKKLPALQTLF